MSSNFLRDFLVWDNWTVGSPTTGGTTTGANPNTALSPAGLLSVNTTTGVISAGFPAPPSPYPNGWLVDVTITLEGIAPYTAPQQVNELMCQIVPISHNGTAFYQYTDWGDFIALSYANQTVTTRLWGAYSQGGISFSVNTSGIAAIGTDNGATHRRIHIAFSAVAY